MWPVVMIIEKTPNGKENNLHTSTTNGTKAKRWPRRRQGSESGGSCAFLLDLYYWGTRSLGRGRKECA